jgi:broad specificity phosphatase PhoE
VAQEFGNWQDVELIKKAKAERRSYGRFWYRFANGESGADVHNRAADFLSTLFRQMDLSSRVERHYVIIAHGLFVRLLCMRYLGWTVKQFEQARARASDLGEGSGVRE